MALRFSSWRTWCRKRTGSSGEATGRLDRACKQGKDVWLALLKRRFRCRHCRKVFTEPDPVCGSRRRTTRRLRQTVARRAREATVRSVAREEGVSEGLVERSWVEAHSLISPPARPHVFLGLDGFCVRRP